MAAAKTGARVETEPSIRPARPGCTICRTKKAAVGFILGVARAGRELVAPQRFGAVLVDALFLRQVVEQLADAGIGGAGGGLPIEVLGLQFHGGGLAADDVEGQRADQPYRSEESRVGEEGGDS